MELASTAPALRSACAHSNATTGAATGLHASSASNSGKGVFAEAVIGVHGLSAEHPVAGTSVGVIGESTAASGTPSGVWGVAQGTSNASSVRGFGGGVGVIGEGVFQGTSGVATGSQGIGVLGKAIHSSGLVSGVQGEVEVIAGGFEDFGEAGDFVKAGGVGELDEGEAVAARGFAFLS